MLVFCQRLSLSRALPFTSSSSSSSHPHNHKYYLISSFEQKNKKFSTLPLSKPTASNSLWVIGTKKNYEERKEEEESDKVLLCVCVFVGMNGASEIIPKGK